MRGRPEEDLNRQIDRVVLDLTREFGPIIPPEDVRRRVMASYLLFATAKIKSFVPLLVRRRVLSELRSLAAPVRPQLGDRRDGATPAAAIMRAES